MALKNYYVYIMTNKPHGVLYTGFTNNLIRRTYQHKHKLIDGFTKKYNVDKLVYYEIHHDPMSAIIREKRIKKWKRAWKIELIEGMNPEWKDLYYDLLGGKDGEGCIGEGFPLARE
ncbi:Excinuclease ABC C subunit domain protein [Caldithrix abyssi DSM 13497]|uniref:Excinuclease ABC C subunit domain protein n=2 Tax=Caldithrix abyssi DSM 13497 TaxID=880073 RepID=H1XRN4_CALAY|nr:GIY-YIG nuclease family protein [Caldithrix abyssi]EHO40187.1 Excinuclease ABC C subunit domain protein [Caldithrix abyssi DSM 13497]